MKKIKKLIKEAVVIIAKKEQKIFGKSVISYGGMPEGEFWIITLNNSYKYNIPKMIRKIK